MPNNLFCVRVCRVTKTTKLKNKKPKRKVYAWNGWNAIRKTSWTQKSGLMHAKGCSQVWVAYIIFVWTKSVIGARRETQDKFIPGPCAGEGEAHRQKEGKRSAENQIGLRRAKLARLARAPGPALNSRVYLSAIDKQPRQDATLNVIGHRQKLRLEKYTAGN